MKTLTESLKSKICESQGLPKNNIVCAAERFDGKGIVVIGEPFTINNKSAWQKAFNLVKSIFPKKEIGWNWDTLEGVDGNMCDALDQDCLDPEEGGVLPNLELVYIHDPEFIGNHEGSIGCFLLNDLVIK